MSTFTLILFFCFVCFWNTSHTQYRRRSIDGVRVCLHTDTSCQQCLLEDPLWFHRSDEKVCEELSPRLETAAHSLIRLWCQGNKMWHLKLSDKAGSKGCMSECANLSSTCGSVVRITVKPKHWSGSQSKIIFFQSYFTSLFDFFILILMWDFFKMYLSLYFLSSYTFRIAGLGSKFHGAVF